MVTKRKCIICDLRPVRIGVMCVNCHKHIQAETKAAKNSGKIVWDRFITYQGKSIGMVNIGHGMGKYKIFSGKLIKSKTIDLNVFCPDLDRDEVKRLKRLVLEMNHAYEFAGVYSGDPQK